jgi:DNA polymerase-3 subunit delta
MSELKTKRSIVLLHGNDDFLVEEAARAVLKDRCAEAEAQGMLGTVRGDVESTEQVLKAIRDTMVSVQTMNMFGSANATWLRGVTFLNGDLFKSQEVKEAVEKFQDALGKGLGPGQFLLITLAGKLDARSRFLKALGGAADVHDFSKTGKEADIKRQSVDSLREMLLNRRIQVGGEVLQDLAARCQNDTRRMMNEVEKLDLYLGERRQLRSEDVDLMVPAMAETQVYLIGDAIAARNLGLIMGIFQRMETEGESNVMVMAVLHNTLREMAFLRALLEQKAVSVSDRGLVYREPAAEAEFQTLTGDRARSPWRQAQLARQSLSFSVAQLDAMLRLSAEAYSQMFRSSLPPFEQLRLLILRIFYGTLGKTA